MRNALRFSLPVFSLFASISHQARCRLVAWGKSVKRYFYDFSYCLLAESRLCFFVTLSERHA